MCNKIDLNKPNWDPVTAWLDTSPDVNELASLDPITAEYERARTTIDFEIDANDGYDTRANGGRRTCTNCDGAGCELCLGTGCANFGRGNL